MTQMSRAAIWGGTGIGAVIAVTPRMPRTLQMLEPTTLPKATSGCRRSAPTTEATSSGSEVPIATMVSPMTASGTPAASASAAAASTRSRAPRMVSLIPPAASASETQSDVGAPGASAPPRCSSRRRSGPWRPDDPGASRAMDLEALPGGRPIPSWAGWLPRLPRSRGRRSCGAARGSGGSSDCGGRGLLGRAAGFRRPAPGRRGARTGRPEPGPRARWARRSRRPPWRR